MKYRILFLSLTFAATLSAQTADAGSSSSEGDPKENAGEAVGLENFWQVKLPDGEYEVALARISSVSRHKYLLDGALIVDEVTIDTVGQALVRFYFIKPASSEASTTAAGKILDKATGRGQELLDKAAERTGSDLQNMVVKKYPETTHARSIEYRILTEAQLTTIFDSAKKSWETGKGKKLTVK